MPAFNSKDQDEKLEISSFKAALNIALRSGRIRSLEQVSEEKCRETPAFYVLSDKDGRQICRTPLSELAREKERVRNRQHAPVSQQESSKSFTIPCPDCGNEVSKIAKFCPKCGRPFRKVSVVEKSNTALIVVGAILSVLFWLALSRSGAILICLISFLPALIASSKGESFLKWYCYGIVFWILAIVHSIAISS